MVFIVGVGRSGTSLMQSILSSHSELCVPPETGFLRNVVLSCKSYKSLTVGEAYELYPRLKRMGLTPSECPSQVFRDKLDFYMSFLESYRKQQNKKYIGDKDPQLVEYLYATSRLFPEAKFIHIVRDPRDVLLSKKKAAWSRSHGSLYHIFANCVQLNLGELAGHQLEEKNYCTVVYERLLQQPESVVAKICDFLNIDYEDSMLHFQKKAAVLVSEDEYQWKQETMGPLLKNNFGKWKGKLADWEVALTESLCRQAFSIGGYIKSDIVMKMPVYIKMMLTVCTFFFRGVSAVYVWYRLAYQKIWILWKT